jgi:competence protein ComGC
MAIGSLICGLFVFLFPLSLVAVILGHLSLSEIRKSAGRIAGRGMAIAGLVLGYLGLSVVPVLIIAAIAIPNLLRARIAANESSAVAAVRTLNPAEVTYAASHPDGFTCSLEALKKAGLITEELAEGKSHGYSIRIEQCEPQPDASKIMSYSVFAVPVNYNQSGRRTFCSNESGVVKFSATNFAGDCILSGTQL